MDEETIRNLISIRKMCPYLKIQGIHYFSGTQKKSAEKIRKELTYLDQFCCELEERTGYQIEELEYGPGLAVSYFEGQTDHLEADVEEIAETLAKMRWKGSQTEPWRAPG